MAYSADAAFLSLLTKSADRQIADDASSVLAGMVLKFDPDELRDDRGRWSAVGAAVHALEHAAEAAAHRDGPPPEPGKDKLKLHGRIHLDPGERLVGSSKVADDYGSVRLAATEKNGVRSLRIGVGDSTFGTRDSESGTWTGGPDQHAAINAERAKLRAEQDALEQRYDSLPTGPERDQAQRRLAELDDTDTDEIVSDGYTAKLDEGGARQLAAALAEIRRNEPDAQRRMEAAWDQLPDGATNFWAQLHEFDPTIDPDGTITVADGVIPGEWGDLYYSANIEEPGAGVRTRLQVVPHGSTREQVADEENDYVLDIADVPKLQRQVDALMGSSTAGKSQRADLTKWTYNPSQSRIGGRFASGTGSNVTTAHPKPAGVRPLNAAAARAAGGKPLNAAAARLTPPPATPAPPRTEAATRSPHTAIGSHDGDTLTVGHRETTQTRQAAGRQRGHDAAVRAQQRAELNAVRASLAAARAKAKTQRATTAQRDDAVDAMKDKYGIPKSLRHYSRDKQHAVAEMDSATRQMVTDRARIATAQAQVAAVRAQYRKGQSAATTAYLNQQLAKAQARLNTANSALSTDQKTFDTAAKKWRGH